MSTTNSTLLGRPIKGDIEHYSRRDAGPQLGPEEFLARLDAIFATGEVSAVIWNQYTPYFNDGEPCEFHTGEVYFYPTKELDPAYDESAEDFDIYDEVYRGMRAISSWSWTDETRVSKETLALVSAWEMGPFQDVLHTHFGDPAVVTATPGGFEVEYFEHD